MVSDINLEKLNHLKKIFCSFPFAISCLHMLHALQLFHSSCIFCPPLPFFFFKSLFSLLSSFRGLNCDLLKLRGRRQWQPTPVLLPRKSHGQRSLVGYSRWGCKESDTTKQLHFTHFTHFILYHWRRKWQPIPVFLSAKSHGQRSLAGHGPWGRRGLDIPEVTKQS